MIRHVLKDGTELSDITGHIVRMKDAEQFYSLLDEINSENRKEKKHGRPDSNA